MSLPATPNPFPTLKEGLALGAREHAGFVNVWNWLCGIMREAKKYFTLGINGRTGDINVVAGEGINVTTEGQTIMISVGTGENTDNDGGGAGGSGGGGAGTNGAGGGGTGGGSGDDEDDGNNSGWTGVPLPEPPAEPSSQCNGWAEGADNGWGDEPNNEGDNCNVLNGW